VRKYGNSNLSMNELFQMWIEGHVEINLSPAEIRRIVSGHTLADARYRR
jgi:hypothetical protein